MRAQGGILGEICKQDGTVVGADFGARWNFWCRFVSKVGFGCHFAGKVEGIGGKGWIVMGGIGAGEMRCGSARKCGGDAAARV